MAGEKKPKCPHVDLSPRPYTGNDNVKRIKFQGRIESANRLNAFIRKKFEEDGTLCFGMLEMEEGAPISRRDLDDLLSYNGKGPNGLTIGFPNFESPGPGSPGTTGA